MKVKKTEKNYIIRLETGEKITDSIKKLCEDYDIKVGTISGLGSVSEAEIALYDFEDKEYYSKKLSGMFEVSNLTGNISTMDNEVYLHIHITLADKEFKAMCGHMVSAVTGATVEITVSAIEGNVGRYFDEEVGLNLYDI